jgi:hypothetical protein
MCFQCGDFPPVSSIISMSPGVLRRLVRQGYSSWSSIINYYHRQPTSRNSTDHRFHLSTSFLLFFVFLLSLFALLPCLCLRLNSSIVCLGYHSFHANKSELKRATARVLISEISLENRCLNWWPLFLIFDSHSFAHVLWITSD